MNSLWIILHDKYLYLLERTGRKQKRNKDAWDFCSYWLTSLPSVSFKTREMIKHIQWFWIRISFPYLRICGVTLASLCYVNIYLFMLFTHDCMPKHYMVKSFKTNIVCVVRILQLIVCYYPNSLLTTEFMTYNRTSYSWTNTARISWMKRKPFSY